MIFHRHHPHSIKNEVNTWRNRFLKALPALLEIEAGNPDKLGDEIKLVLSELKRPSTPPEFVAEQIVRIIDLACKSSEDFGYEVSHWNLPLLVKEIKKQGIAEQISENLLNWRNPICSNIAKITGNYQCRFYD